MSTAGGSQLSAASSKKKKRRRNSDQVITQDGMLSNNRNNARSSAPSYQPMHIPRQPFNMPPHSMDFMQGFQHYMRGGMQGGMQGMQQQPPQGYQQRPYHQQPPLQQQPPPLQPPQRHIQAASTAPPAAASAAISAARSNNNDTFEEEEEEAQEDLIPLGDFPCAWSKEGHCTHSHLDVRVKCNEKGCENLVHHVCQNVWAQSIGEEAETEGCLIYCSDHHPHFNSKSKPKPRGSGGGSDDEEMDERMALFDTDISAKQTYNASLTVGSKKRQHNLPLLRAMGTGALSNDELQVGRMEEYVSKGYIKKSDINVSNDLLRNEITRRYNIEKKIDSDGDHRKNPKLSGAKKNLEERLGNVPTNPKDPVYPLKYDTEKRYIKRKVREVLDEILSQHEAAEEEKIARGDHLRNETFLRIRFVHALLGDNSRTKLMQAFDSMKRGGGGTGIDSRNSEDRELNIWEEAAHQYNDSSFAPVSLLLSDLHTKFAVAMDLSLPERAQKMTPEQAKKLAKDLFAKLKKAIEHWQGSGNGQDGQAEDGEKIRLSIKGTTYNISAEDQDDDEDVIIKHVDDDRFKFCGGNLVLAYIWGYLETIGLTTFAVQSAKAVGLISGESVASARGGGRTKTRTKAPRGIEAIESMYKMLPEIMQEAMKPFAVDEKKRELMQVEDQHRKSLALWSVRSDEYENTLLEYEMKKAEGNLNDRVLKVFKEIVDSRLTKAREAAAELRHWDERREALREEIEQPTQQRASGNDNESKEEDNDDDGNMSEEDEEEEEDRSHKSDEDTDEDTKHKKLEYSDSEEEDGEVAVAMAVDEKNDSDDSYDSQEENQTTPSKMQRGKAKPLHCHSPDDSSSEEESDEEDDKKKKRRRGYDYSADPSMQGIANLADANQDDGERSDGERSDGERSQQSAEDESW